MNWPGITTEHISSPFLSLSLLSFVFFFSLLCREPFLVVDSAGFSLRVDQGRHRAIRHEIAKGVNQRLEIIRAHVAHVVTIKEHKGGQLLGTAMSGCVRGTGRARRRRRGGGRRGDSRRRRTLSGLSRCLCFDR